MSSIRLGSLLSLAVLVLIGVGAYHYFHGHMDALSGYENGLKEKWEKLWNWYLISLALILGGIILALIIPALGLLATLTGSIGILVLSVLEMIYLYQTAIFFRFYQQPTEQTHHSRTP